MQAFIIDDSRATYEQVAEWSYLQADALIEFEKKEREDETNPKP